MDSFISVTCKCGACYSVPSFSRGELLRCVKCGHANKILGEDASSLAGAPSERRPPAPTRAKQQRQRKIGLYAGGLGAFAILVALLAIRAKV
jgi:hypothetical protein